MIKQPLSLEHALLGFLRHQPMHAYEMHQHLEQAEALGLVWHLKQSQLYALLARLEAAGYIDSTIELQGNRPPRKLLRLTYDGQAALERWVAMPVAHGRDFRQDFLAKLFFAQQDGPAPVAQLIAAQRAACEGWLADLQSQIDGLAPSRTYERLVLQFRVSNIEAIRTWLDRCADTFAVALPPTTAD